MAVGPSPTQDTGDTGTDGAGRVSDTLRVHKDGHTPESSMSPLSTQPSSMEHKPADPAHRAPPCQLLQPDTPDMASLRCSSQRHITLSGIFRYQHGSLALLITLPIPGVPYLPSALNYCCWRHSCTPGLWELPLPESAHRLGVPVLLQLLAWSPSLPLHMLPPPAAALVDMLFSCLRGCGVSSHWLQELLPQPGALLSLSLDLISGAGPKSTPAACPAPGTWSLQHTDGTLGGCRESYREMK